MSEQISRKRARDQDNEATPPTEPLKEFILALTNLGDPHARISFEEELKLCCTDIKALWSTEQQTVVESIVECLMGLPHKSSKYSLLIALLLTEHEDCAAAVVARLCNMFIMEEKPWWLMGQLIRVFSELATLRVISTGSLVELLDKVFSSFPNGNAIVSMHFGLPFAIKVLSMDNAEFLSKCIQTMEEVLSRQEIRSSKYLMNINYLSTFSKIQKLVDSSPFVRISPVDSEKAPLPISLPESLSFSMAESHSLPVNVLPNSTVMEPDFVDSWEELVAYRHAFHLLSCASFNPRKCCDLLFASVPERIGSPEKVISQMLFGEIMSSTSTSVDAEFIMIYACRHSKLFPSAMARCLLRLVDLIDEAHIDHFKVRSMASWFALHLSTFDFKWPWDEWKMIVDLPDHNAKVMFVSIAFEYLSRLSYHEKLLTAIPSFLHGLLPPAPKPFPTFENHQSVVDFINDIRSKKPSSEVVEKLTSRDDMHKCIEALLTVGSKSFSHVSVLLDRYLDVIKVIFGDSIDDQVEVLTLISAFWKNQVQNFELIVNKLFEYGILKTESFIKWSVSSLEAGINGAEMPLFVITKRFLPSAIIFSSFMLPYVSLLGQSLKLVVGDLVADKQVTDLISGISMALELSQC